MSQYDEDLKEAAEFREEIHRMALKEVRRFHPEADHVVDRCPASSYPEQVWDYPGA